ncbi:AAA-type ATPase lid domain-containing protein [Clostridium aromativorans]
MFNIKYNIMINLSEYSKTILNNYSWPGNIRELEYLLEILVISAPFPNYIIPKEVLTGSITGPLKRITLIL